MVIIIALGVSWLWGQGEQTAVPAEGSLVSAVTGTTDKLTDADTAGDPEISPTPGREGPSQTQWEALLPRLQEIVRNSPEDETALRKLALAYYNLGSLPEAADIYRRLLAKEEDPVLRDRLGNTLRDMGDLDGAEETYRKAIADDPSLAPPYLNLAELLWRQGRDSEAQSVLEEGIEVVPVEAKDILIKGREVLSGQKGASTT